MFLYTQECTNLTATFKCFFLVSFDVWGGSGSSSSAAASIRAGTGLALQDGSTSGASASRAGWSTCTCSLASSSPSFGIPMRCSCHFWGRSCQHSPCTQTIHTISGHIENCQRYSHNTHVYRYQRGYNCYAHSHIGCKQSPICPQKKIKEQTRRRCLHISSRAVWEVGARSRHPWTHTCKAAHRHHCLAR